MNLRLNCSQIGLACTLLVASYANAGSDCPQISKFGLCTNTSGCAWVEKYCHGRCVAIDDQANMEEEDFSDDAPIPVCRPEYLGCTVDESQCSLRAAHAGYSHYQAERSYNCANAAKFACWGK